MPLPTLQIDICRIRGPGTTALTAQWAVERAAAGFEAGSAIPPSAILVIRKVRGPVVKRAWLGAPGHMQKNWTAEFEDRVARLYSEARRPAIEAVPADAGAVVFSDMADLIHCLATDLLHHTTDRWWWLHFLDAGKLRIDTTILFNQLYANPHLIPEVIRRSGKGRIRHDLLDLLNTAQAAVLTNRLWQAFFGSHTGLEHLSGEVLVAGNRGRARMVTGEHSRDSGTRTEAVTPDPRRVLRELGIALSETARPMSRQSITDSIFRRIAESPFPERVSDVPANSLPAPPSGESDGWVSGSVTDPTYVDDVDGSGIRNESRTQADNFRSDVVRPGGDAGNRSDRIINSDRTEIPVGPDYPDTVVPPGHFSRSFERLADPTVKGKHGPVSVGEITGSRIRSDGKKPVAGSDILVQTGTERVDTQLAGLLYLVNVLKDLRLPGCFDDIRDLEKSTGPWGILELLGRMQITGVGPNVSDDPLWKLLAELDGRRPGILPEIVACNPDQYFLPRQWASHAGIAAETVFLQTLNDRVYAWLPDGYVAGVWKKSSTSQALADVEDLFPGAIIELRAGDLPVDPVAGPLIQNLTRNTRFRLALIWPYIKYRYRGLFGPLQDSPVPSYVMRRGTIFVTRTHLDVVQSLEAIDINIRMAGLDRDPGWLPEFQRVIQFHFR